MTELIQYTFFQHALLGGLLASIACGIIGTYIVTRRLVFISGGITHASFGGIGIGLFTGISPLLSAAVFSVLSAFGVEWLSKRKDMLKTRPLRCSGHSAWRWVLCLAFFRRASHPIFRLISLGIS